MKDFRGEVFPYACTWWAWRVLHVPTGEVVASGSEFDQPTAMQEARKATIGARLWWMYGRKDVTKFR